MTVKPLESNDRWDVEYVSEVSEKAQTRLAGAEANSGWEIAGDEKATRSRGLGIPSDGEYELTSRWSFPEGTMVVPALGRRSRT